MIFKKKVDPISFQEFEFLYHFSEQMDFSFIFQIPKKSVLKLLIHYEYFFKHFRAEFVKERRGNPTIKAAASAFSNMLWGKFLSHPEEIREISSDFDIVRMELGQHGVLLSLEFFGYLAYHQEYLKSIES